RDAAGQRTIVLQEKQSRHFASSGISKVSDFEHKFARFSQSPALDHFVLATEYVHWSFDEPGGEILKADAFGRPLGAFNARLEEVSEEGLAVARTEGRWDRALRFNGNLFARA